MKHSLLLLLSLLFCGFFFFKSPSLETSEEEETGSKAVFIFRPNRSSSETLKLYDSPKLTASPVYLRYTSRNVHFPHYAGSFIKSVKHFLKFARNKLRNGS